MCQAEKVSEEYTKGDIIQSGTKYSNQLKMQTAVDKSPNIT